MVVQLTHIKKAFLLLLFLAVGRAAALAQVHNSCSYKYLLTEESVLEHIDFLTCDSIAGRAAGTRESKIVADYIASKFEDYGLLPFKSISYFQQFGIPAPKKNGSVSGGGYNQAYRNISAAAKGQYGLKGHNVVAFLPAAKKNAKYIIVGAHYDHIGSIGGNFYPGADDNASGVAAMLEIAKMFGQRYREHNNLEYNMVFVGFDANNFSLLGSRIFVEKMGLSPNKILCMLNIDQIGSTLAPVGDNKEYLLVLGADKLAPWQREQIDFVNSWFTIGLQLDYSYYGSEEFYSIFYKLSDQHNFTLAGIPALLFTSGITVHTNKESDTVENLSLPVLRKRIELIYRFLWFLG